MQKRNQKSLSAGPLRVSTAAQFDALASPVRDQIVQVVVNHVAASPGEGVSIREIAEQLGRKAGSLYRHMQELCDAGLIREVGTRPSGGRDATMYTADGPALVLALPKGEGADLEALCRYVERMGAHAGKESAEGVRARVRGAVGAEVQGSASLIGWLDKQQIERVRGMLHELAAVFADAKRRPKTQFIAASLLIRPVQVPAERGE